MSTKNLRFAFWLNSAFVIIELLGGYYTNSLAILSDAFHDFGDSMMLGLAWYFQHLALRGRDERYTYGYRRFSLLGALLNGVVLLIGSVLIIFFAIRRFNEPQEAMADGMIVLALLGIVINYIALQKLKSGSSLNERTIGLHLLADVLGWVAVLAGALVMKFTGWYGVDPLLSVAIALYIIFGAIKNVIESTNIILQKVPKDIDLRAIENELQGIVGVERTFDLHVWTLDGERTILSVHLVVTAAENRQHLIDIRREARKRLAQLGIRHSTIEINLPNEAYFDEPDQ
jgi:cobalt-zinc-cadmium efflux system protein